MFERTPLIGDLQPGGKYLARDLHRVGGVPSVLKALLDGGHLHGDALDAVGSHAGRGARGAAGARRRGRARAATALQPTGGVVVLKGNLAPDGALIKIAGLQVARASKARPASSSARKTRARR